MRQNKPRNYEVYRDAERIRLNEFTWEGELTGNPSLKVKVSIDGRIIENVIFKRDIASRAYAIPPDNHGAHTSEVTILFGGEVQEILDRFADYLIPPMKPLGINHLTGEKVLDWRDRIDTGEIENRKRKISDRQFIWQK